tara:strand:+ start:636 stop:800 length:165 start_codon:yes stop_codon:yes gene_type:complete
MANSKEEDKLEKQLEFDFEELKQKKEKERKQKFNLPEHPLDNLLKDKKSWKKKT